MGIEIVFMKLIIGVSLVYCTNWKFYDMNSSPTLCHALTIYYYTYTGMVRPTGVLKLCPAIYNRVSKG